MTVRGMIWLGMTLTASAAGASDLTIHLNGSETVRRSTVKYQCDAQGTKMGLPAGVFSVEYLNGAGNHLAVVPVKGNSMIFVTVPSGSGAKYAAEEFTWWEAGGKRNHVLLRLSRTESLIGMPYSQVIRRSNLR